MRKRLRIFILYTAVFSLLISLLYFLKGSTATRIETNTSPQISKWPALFHTTGSYGIRNALDAERASQEIGATISIRPYTSFNPETKAAYQKYGIKVVDSSIWNSIRTQCDKNEAATGATECKLSTTDESDLLTKADAYLKKIENNTDIVGLYILDDNPGPISNTLQAIHERIVAANVSRIVKLPTVCGFGGSLDYKKTISSTSFDGARDTQLKRVLANYSPKSCDAVILYPYGRNTFSDPSSIDWSMKRVLPLTLELLRDKGWDPKLHPLIGAPQGFAYVPSTGDFPDNRIRYVLPRAEDIATQITAYCSAGATSIISYAWDDSYTKNKVILSNSADLRAGYNKGITNCKTSFWTTPHTATPIITSKPTPSPTPPTPIPSTPLRPVQPSTPKIANPTPVARNRNSPPTPTTTIAVASPTVSPSPSDTPSVKNAARSMQPTAAVNEELVDKPNNGLVIGGLLTSIGTLLLLGSLILLL